MNNSNQETKKIVTGVLLGVLGAGALYCIYASKHKKTPFLQKVGRTIADVGEMIEHCDLSSVNHVVEKVEEKIPQGTDMVNNVGQWLSTGLSIWKKISK